jgi:hypothetical protein
MNKIIYDRLHGRSEWLTTGNSQHKSLMNGETVNGIASPQIKKVFKFEQIKRIFKKWKRN